MKNIYEPRKNRRETQKVKNKINFVSAIFSDQRLRIKIVELQSMTVIINKVNGFEIARQNMVYGQRNGETRLVVRKKKKKKKDGERERRESFM